MYCLYRLINNTELGSQYWVFYPAQWGEGGSFYLLAYLPLDVIFLCCGYFWLGLVGTTLPMSMFKIGYEACRECVNYCSLLVPLHGYMCMLLLQDLFKEFTAGSLLLRMRWQASLFVFLIRLGVPWRWGIHIIYALNLALSSVIHTCNGK